MNGNNLANNSFNLTELDNLLHDFYHAQRTFNQAESSLGTAGIPPIVALALDNAEQAIQAYIDRTVDESQPEPEICKDEVRDVLERLAGIISRKNHDYGTDNLFQFGLFGILVRMSDKFERLKTYHQRGELKVTNETVEQALLDLAGYAVQALAKGITK